LLVVVQVAQQTVATTHLVVVELADSEQVIRLLLQPGLATQ
jgi:hypothetical protein